MIMTFFGKTIIYKHRWICIHLVIVLLLIDLWHSF